MALILAIGSRVEQAMYITYGFMLTLEALYLFSDKMLAISKLSNIHTMHTLFLLIFLCPKR